MFFICFGSYGHIKHPCPQQYPLSIKNSCDNITISASNYSIIISSSGGGVSSFTDLTDVPDFTLTNNSASLKTAYGNTYVKGVAYYPGTTGYEIKYVKGNSDLVPCNKKCY